MTLPNLPNNLLPKRLEKRLLKRSFVALIVIAMLGACADNKDVDPIPSGAPSSTKAEQSADPGGSSGGLAEPTSPADEPTKTPDIELTPPELPEAAKEYTEEGAIAFTEYFYEVFEYSYKINNEKLLNSISTNECHACAKMVETIAQLRNNDNRIVDLTIISTDIRFHSMKKETASLFAGYKTSLYQIISNDSQETVESEFNNRAIILKWNGSWKVQAFGIPEDVQ